MICRRLGFYTRCRFVVVVLVAVLPARLCSNLVDSPSCALFLCARCYTHYIGRPHACVCRLQRMLPNLEAAFNRCLVDS